MDMHERVAMEFCRYSTNAHHKKFTKILRREYGPMTDMHTAADKAAKVWMERAQKDEREIDTLKAELAEALLQIDYEKERNNIL